MQNSQVAKNSLFNINSLKKIFQKTINKSNENNDFLVINHLFTEYEQALKEYKIAQNNFNFVIGDENIDIANEQLTICKIKLNLAIRKMKNIAEVN